MEAASKIVTSLLLLNLALLLPCLSAAAVSSSNTSFHPSMSKGHIRHGDYTRFADVERHCQSVLSSAAELQPDPDRDAVLRLHLSFMNGDWTQDAGQAPLLPLHGSYAADDDDAAAGPEPFETVPLASFMLTHIDTAPWRGARTAVNVSGLLSFTITRNCCCSYMGPEASEYFELWPGVARLLVPFQGVYTETKPSGSDDGGGGERVLCMVADAVLPVPCTNSADPAKIHGGDSNFKPPVVADGNILLVLRYPKTQTLTTRAVRGEMMSTSAKSHGAYFDTVRLVSQVSVKLDSGYQFQPEDAAGLDAVAGCGDDSLFQDGGDTMDPPNSGASLCRIIYQCTRANQMMEVIPNRDCKGTDAFCSLAGPFDTTLPATSAADDMAFTRPAAVAVQGLRCEATESTDGAPAARVSAVFRYVSPWEDRPTAAKRTGLSGATLSVEGVWTASTGRVCMVGCLGAGKEACRYRVSLSVRTAFSITRRGNIAGQITAMDGSRAPLLFQQRVNSRFDSSWVTPRMSYVYTKVELARELLRASEPSGFRDSFLAKSLLSYPNIAGAADDTASLSNLAENLNLGFCVVKPPFVPDQMEETFFELQILSIGTLVGSYSAQFQSRSSKWIELLGRVVHGADKMQILNVSAEFMASRNFLSPTPVMSLEGVYNPEDGRMYLIGCRSVVHVPWQVLSKRRDELEDGMDCSIEVIVEYPPTITRWLISQTAKVSIASTREEDDPLHFATSELRTTPVTYCDRRWDQLMRPIVEVLLSITLLSAVKIFLVPVAFFQLFS